MSIFIKNGFLVSSSGTMPADVHIEDDRISNVGRDIGYDEADRVIDAAGMFLLPGGIDPHVHMHLPSPAGFSSDDFLSGSRAALYGGTTTLIDFVTPEKGEPMPHALEKQMREAEHSLTDYSFHVSPVEWRESIPGEIRECIRMGATSFKVYMAYKQTVGLGDEDLLRVMKAVGKAGGTVTVHCEEGDEIEKLRERFFLDGHTLPLYHLLSRPSHLEASAVKKAIELAAKAECPLYIVHVSAAESLEHIREARSRGQTVYAETCPQYLLLDNSKYTGPFEQTSPYVISPPLRTEADSDALWHALADGTIRTVGTDHCPFTAEQKRAGLEDFRKIPGGSGGVEHRLALLYTYGILTGRLNFNHLVNLCSSEPARIFGIYPRKGDISAGSDADIVIWNPEQAGIISAESHHMNCDINIYEGMAVRGSPEYVIKGGEVVIEKGVMTGQERRGNYLLRTIS
ncbi:MAG: dihydropyrimidinase [Bacteroidales bacterium]|nr:dihydropyrimidinase [Bacteroidales bacterium]MDT8374433.1 dihydropyrimidinase [Bacteroidales bacterium]